MDETTTKRTPSRIPTTRDTVIAKSRQCGRHWLFVGDQWVGYPEPQTVPEQGTTGGE